MLTIRRGRLCEEERERRGSNEPEWWFNAGTWCARERVNDDARNPINGRAEGDAVESKENKDEGRNCEGVNDSWKLTNTKQGDAIESKENKEKGKTLWGSEWFLKLVNVKTEVNAVESKENKEGKESWASEWGFAKALQTSERKVTRLSRKGMHNEECNREVLVGERDNVKAYTWRKWRLEGMEIISNVNGRGVSLNGIVRGTYGSL